MALDFDAFAGAARTIIMFKEDGRQVVETAGLGKPGCEATPIIRFRGEGDTITTAQADLVEKATPIVQADQAIGRRKQTDTPQQVSARPCGRLALGG